MNFYSHKCVLFITLFALSLGNFACGIFGSNDNNKPPAVPTGLKGISGDGKISLEWTHSSPSDLVGYNIYRSLNSFSNSSSANRVNGSKPINNTSYDDTKVENGKTYFYRITATDDNGNESTLSVEISKTPFPDPPDDP